MTDEAAAPDANQDSESVPAAPAVVVRPAVPEDALVIKVLLKQSMSEVQEGQFSRINDAKARAYIDLCIEEGACLVAVYQEAIIGTICLRTLQEIWSDDQFLNEEWFYVLPRFRDTGAAVKLLGTAEQLADQMGLPVFFAINSHDPEPLERVLDSRTGYRTTGRNYLRKPRDGKQEVDNDLDS
jgi:GNAT superfamily N-acetyltransferase